MKTIPLWCVFATTPLTLSICSADNYSVTAVPGLTAIANQLDNGGNTLTRAALSTGGRAKGRFLSV
jgi:hypothetical protein